MRSAFIGYLLLLPLPLLAPLDLDVLASSPQWRCGSPIAAVVAAPLDLDVLAALVAIALVAALVAELEP